MKTEDKLSSFIAEDKFGQEAWQERGLIQSPKPTIDLMEEIINNIAANVLHIYKEGKTKKTIKKVLT